jgi:DNA replication protein DnaC
MRVLSSFDTVPPEERTKMEMSLIESDFLVLDDVGREYRKEGSSWVGSNIDAYFRKRMNSHLPTLMTSNFSLTKMRDLYGDSIMSILRGSLVEIEVTGKDYRLVEGKQKRDLINGTT